MVIKNWYSSGKSIESHDWMVICSIGTWEKHFYFCFIVFLSICLMQVLIYTLLTIKVSMLKRKKKCFSFSYFRRNYISHLSSSENSWGIVLCMAFSPSCSSMPLWAHVHTAQQLLSCSYLTGPISISRNWVLRITELGQILTIWFKPFIWNACFLELGNHSNLIWVK